MRPGPRGPLPYHPLAVRGDPVGGDHTAHHIVAGPAVYLVGRWHHGRVAAVAGDGDVVVAAPVEDLRARKYEKTRTRNREERD